MCHMPSKEVIENRSGRKIILFLVSLALLQTLSFILIRFDLATVNPKIFFGQYFDNETAIIVVMGLLIPFWHFLKNVLKAQVGLRNIILASVCSNLLDRVFYGGVVDFIDLAIIPVFNAADMVIIIGLILLCLDKTRKN